MNQKIKLRNGNLIGLDLGKSRTGVARINTVARIAEPLAVIKMSDNFTELVNDLVNQHDAQVVVVGLPRGLDGQKTQQTVWAEGVIDDLKRSLAIPVYPIDEAGTTVEARSMNNSGHSVDSLAAGIIVEDFINEVVGGRLENVSI